MENLFSQYFFGSLENQSSVNKNNNVLTHLQHDPQ